MEKLYTFHRFFLKVSELFDKTRVRNSNWGDCTYVVVNVPSDLWFIRLVLILSVNSCACSSAG